MGRYLVLWQLDKSKMPVNPKERAAAYTPLVAMVKQSVEMGKVKDWGTFAGEGRGYNIFEGTELELSLQLEQYVPFADFEVHPLMSLGQVEEMIKVMTS